MTQKESHRFQLLGGARKSTSKDVRLKLDDMGVAVPFWNLYLPKDEEAQAADRHSATTRKTNPRPKTGQLAETAEKMISRIRSNGPRGSPPHWVRPG